jgi:hypothetical protein
MKKFLSIRHGVGKVFFAFTALLVLGSFYYFLVNKTGNPFKKTGASMSIFKMAFPYKTSIKEYEPTNIQLAPQYALLENLFSPLIELNPKGEIQSGVAERFEWYGNELHFFIRKSLKTIDSIQITAQDVEFSLKRLLVQTGNTHGNLKDILCPNADLKSVNDSCPNLEVRNDFLVVFKPPKKDVFLVKMLSAIDFSIIPKSSVDLQTLKIKDYRNTTGPYYVAKDDPNGNIVLAANSHHYHYSKQMPQQVELVPSNQDRAESSLEDFKSGKVDFITEADSTKSEKLIEFASNDKNSVLHSTINIRMFVLTFTQKGLKKISVKKRFLIGKKLKSIFRELLLGRGLYQGADQVFPVFGEGSIDSDEVKLLEQAYSKVEEESDFTGKNLTLGFVRMGDLSSYIEGVHKVFPDLHMFETKSSLFFQENPSESEVPDMVISGPDTGFLEDISLISYTLNAGILGLSKVEARDWLKDYMETIEKKKRLKKLQKLHFDALIQPAVVPLVSSPYVALTKNPWKLNLPKYFANNALWLVEKE